MYFDEKFWIAAAFILFVSLIYKKISSFISTSLDKKLENIKAEIHEAEKLKKEAQEILKNYKKEQKAAEKKAAEIISKAEESAKELLQKSKAEIKKNEKTKIAEIEKTLELKRTNFIDGLRKEISNQAIEITNKYLANNKDSIKEQSYQSGLESLKNQN